MNKVACFGAFDYDLHEGHRLFLELASKHGELTVFLVADETIQRHKSRKPYYSQSRRMENIAELGYKARAFQGGYEADAQSLLEFNPDVPIFTLDAITYPFERLLFIRFAERFKSGKTRLVGINRLPGISTTALLKQIGYLK